MSSLSLNVATYNVLRPHKENEFDYLPSKGQIFRPRLDQVAQNIISGGADVIMLQEIGEDFFEKLTDRVNQLSSVKYVGRHAIHNGDVGGYPGFYRLLFDGVGILFNSSLTVREVCQIPSNKHSSTRRRELFIDFETDGKIVRCATAQIYMHRFDSYDEKSDNSHLEEALKFILDDTEQTYRVDAYVIGVDLREEAIDNTRYSGERFRILGKHGFNTDDITTPSIVNSTRKIDHIFVKGATINSSVKNTLPVASNHHMIVGNVEVYDSSQSGIGLR